MEKETELEAMKRRKVMAAYNAANTALKNNTDPARAAAKAYADLEALSMNDNGGI